MKRTFVAIAALAMVTHACGDSSSDPTIPAVLPDIATAPALGPEVDNTYFPLIPGNRWVYEGFDQGERERIEVVVLDETREMSGFTAIVVRDVVELDDSTIEDTFDWYAQDGNGNVWYVGEDSKEIEDGEVVSTDGSWEHGVDGALAGIMMYADPGSRIGEAYYQEFYEGEAEDKGEVLEVGLTVTVPAGTFQDVVLTRDWDPLEPGVFERKYYAPGVGVILEEVEGTDEKIELLEFSPAG